MRSWLVTSALLLGLGSSGCAMFGGGDEVGKLAQGVGYQFILCLI